MACHTNTLPLEKKQKKKQKKKTTRGGEQPDGGLTRI